MQNQGDVPVQEQQQPLPISSNASKSQLSSNADEEDKDDEEDIEDREDEMGDDECVGVNDNKTWPFHEELQSTKRKQESGI